MPCPKLAFLFGLALAGGAVPAAGAQFPLAADQTAIGRLDFYATREGDLLVDIAQRHDLGYTQLVAANRGVDPWLPRAASRVTLPTLYLLPDAPRHGIVINLAEQRLFYFRPRAGIVETFPVGVSVEAGETPLGLTRIVAKETTPSWYPPPSIRAERPDLPKVVPPGPDNPLGNYALRLGWENILIHGTNKA